MTDEPMTDEPMTDEPMTDERAEEFGRYVDALLDEERPSPDDVADDEAIMAIIATGLKAAGRPESETPDPAFAEQLRLRMREADRGIAAVSRLPSLGLGRVRISRRDLLRTGIGAAVGLAAGGSAVAVLGGRTRNVFVDPGSSLASDGEWTPVALLADLPAGSVARFSTAAFAGFLVNDDGQIRALSSVCTHMGCTLAYRPAWRDLRCPCHGASFDLYGHLANGTDRWSEAGGSHGDPEAYPIQLPPLVRPQVKVEGDQILLLAPRASTSRRFPYGLASWSR
jgi:cytochrome b6-f complex iron-sulfur subunit